MKEQRCIYYAHSANALKRCQTVLEHLTGTAELAREFAEPLGRAEEAVATAMAHDVGKYSELFKRRLKGLESGLDHWSLGAYLMLSQGQSIQGALAIQGHHIGLQSGDTQSVRSINPKKLAKSHPLRLRLTDDNVDAVLKLMKADGVEAPHPLPGRPRYPFSAAEMLDVRMLYSTLVDADFLDTEAHMKQGDPTFSRPAGLDLDAPRAYELLIARIADIESKSMAATAVRELRADLRAACIEAGERPVGLYTLTAPTGAGKTLSMLAFALKHAIEHPEIRRIVVAIPYLSIIEQTAALYADIFREIGGNYVLEHHSMAESGRRRSGRDSDVADEVDLLSENWDAPLIVTTNVQILESLFSNRPSACRKLHRLARSVVLFDEAQTLPPHLAEATLGALSHLSSRYQSTIVFSTATQPAFGTLDSRVVEINDGGSGWKPTEIVDGGLKLFGRIRKVEVSWPSEGERLSWNDLAVMMNGARQAVCVVNLKRHAKALLETLGEDEDAYHLSTSLCPAHRTRVLARARKRLREGLPCKLVSTQCLEAGVDLSAPMLFRALADPVSVAQAAGRCNREGTLRAGQVVVFVPEDEGYPDPAYEQAARITMTMLKQHGGRLDIDDPATYQEFYDQMYSLTGACDTKETRSLRDLITKMADFPKVAETYRLIKSDTINVLVPYKEELAEFEALSREVREGGITSGWVRRARKLSVSLFRPSEDSPIYERLERVKTRSGEETRDWFIHAYSIYGEDGYDPRLGLVTSQISLQIG